MAWSTSDVGAREAGLQTRIRTTRDGLDTLNLR